MPVQLWLPAPVPGPQQRPRAKALAQKAPRIQRFYVPIPLASETESTQQLSHTDSKRIKTAPFPVRLRRKSEAIAIEKASLSEVSHIVQAAFQNSSIITPIPCRISRLFIFACPIVLQIGSLKRFGSCSVIDNLQMFSNQCFTPSGFPFMVRESPYTNVCTFPQRDKSIPHFHAPRLPGGSLSCSLGVPTIREARKKSRRRECPTCRESAPPRDFRGESGESRRVSWSPVSLWSTRQPADPVAKYPCLPACKRFAYLCPNHGFQSRVRRSLDREVERMSSLHPALRVLFSQDRAQDNTDPEKQIEFPADLVCVSLRTDKAFDGLLSFGL